ncbi:MAG: CoA-binding protein [Desulfobacterales bacterium]
MRADPDKLERAFNPKVIAIVGDSGYLEWLRCTAKFSGKRYSVQVNPKTIARIEAMGVDNFTSLLDIPEPVDFVIVAVGRKYALDVLEDCISKEIPAGHFFTAGFTETHTADGAEFEAALTRRATESGFHLIGPNCLGIFNPGIGLRQEEAQYVGTTGPVGFISQSGTHAMQFSLEAHLQGVDISKSVSFGNGSVLDAAEFLDYFGRDDSIKVIGMYLEGVRDGRRLIEVLRDVSSRKPVVVWKGGRTAGSSRAIASHTGSLAVPQNIWVSTMRQCGAITVSGLDEIVDTLKALIYLKPVEGNRVVLAGGSGGQSVAISDAFTEIGLEVPPLSQASYDQFESFFSVIGGSYSNPIDTGNQNQVHLPRIMDIIEKDANTDNIVLLLNAGSGPPGVADQKSEEIETAIALSQRTAKPVMVCSSVFFLPTMVGKARAMIKTLQGGGVPVFTSLERGALALKNALDYYRFRSR